MSAKPKPTGIRVLELRTRAGSVYVVPTFWQGVRLRWIFRNFRSLPKQVLNSRQQRLIERLARTPNLTRSAISGASVIGAVENVAVAEVKTEAAVTASKVVEMKAAMPTAPAVGFESPAIRPRIARRRRIDFGHTSAASRTVDAPLARTPNPAEPQPDKKELLAASADVISRVASPRYRVRWLLAAVPVLLLLISSISSRQGWANLWGKLSALGVESPEAVPPPPPAPPPPSQAFEPPTSPANVAAVSKPAAGAVAAKHEIGKPAEEVPSRLTLADLQASAERVQTEEPPLSGFAYPVAPNPNLTGIVTLKAVIASDGTVKDVDVLSGKQPLAAAAVRAVRHWRYRPQEFNGHAVEAETNIVISFVGEDAVSIRFPSTP